LSSATYRRLGGMSQLIIAHTKWGAMTTSVNVDNNALAEVAFQIDRLIVRGINRSCWLPTRSTARRANRRLGGDEQGHRVTPYLPVSDDMDLVS
jgi:hypothetical protein